MNTKPGGKMNATGKKRMQLAWAREVHLRTGMPAIILDPLAITCRSIDAARSCPVVLDESTRFIKSARRVK